MAIIYGTTGSDTIDAILLGYEFEDNTIYGLAGIDDIWGGGTEILYILMNMTLLMLGMSPLMAVKVMI